MLWDAHDLARYEKWHHTEAGAFALAQEFRLLARLTATWPRRGRTLLDIGCGHGVFLEFFHGAGFDVSGLDKSPVMLAAARQRLGHVADLRLGEASHLPFDDNSFDYASLLTVLEFVDDPQAVLLEAARVAKRGLIVGYLNGFSLYRLVSGKGRFLSQARWYFPWRMRAMAHEVLGHAPLRERSVLLGPPATWRRGFPFFKVGRMVLPPWLGAYGAIAANLESTPPLTPLPAWRTGILPTKSF